ncbi:hypothetical protein GCM10011575_31130 [Microlunatus endophyticus]|uniref:VOC domain-containing protein n=1 Tax=Microlunatus endophyticus TaxID=1716077 RepID=A0A917SBL2_9ACTN|nr:hypothetical protein [Microlunatus endophyticus]GGL70447.1 hypothetical protein GCM10011575_31130 [Microlunatus endophyticus]
MTMRIDHVYIEVPDPEAMQAALADLLGLALAWPVKDYGAFRSGGLALGPFNLELVRFAGTDPRPAEHRLDGIALSAASLHDAAADLASVGRAMGAPQPFRAQGSMLWTNADVPALLPPPTPTFVCIYEPELSRALARAAAAPAPAADVEIILPAGEQACAWSRLRLPWTAGTAVASRVRIVVDDPDTDRAQRYLRELHLPIRLVRTLHDGLTAEQMTPNTGPESPCRRGW